MEKQRKIKILSIVALVLAIVSMTLGFAAFSTTLSVSSSASVSPNSSNFNVVFCEAENFGYCADYPEIDWNISKKTTNGAQASNIADADGLKASGLGASFTATNQSVIYTFYVHNLGEYDAYLRSITFEALDNGSYKKCSSTGDASESLVEVACDGINVTLSIGGTTYAFGSSNISGHLLSKGSVEEVIFTIEYIDGAVLADGDFDVEISDFKLDYSTVDSTVELVYFTIDDVSYTAAEGMTWAEWILSSYNTGGYTDSNAFCTADDLTIASYPGPELRGMYYFNDCEF